MRYRKLAFDPLHTTSRLLFRSFPTQPPFLFRPFDLTQLGRSDWLNCDRFITTSLPSPQSSSLGSLQPDATIRNKELPASKPNMSGLLKKASDPIARPLTPAQDPSELGPRSKQLAAGTSSFHSTSLRNMVSNTVNKTALHPSGVQ